MLLSDLICCRYVPITFIVLGCALVQLPEVVLFVYEYLKKRKFDKNRVQPTMMNVIEPNDTENSKCRHRQFNIIKNKDATFTDLDIQIRKVIESEIQGQISAAVNERFERMESRIDQLISNNQ